MPALPTRSVLLGLAFVCSALPAAAQGTAEQQEACTPDAVRLCRDTIPDIPKTTACMKAHFAELTPRCRTAFGEATAPKTEPGTSGAAGTAPARREPPRTRTARRAEDASPPPALPPRRRAPRDDDAVVVPAPVLPVEPVPERVPGLRSYAARIAGYCREGLIDPFTCRTTLDALRLSE